MNFIIQPAIASKFAVKFKIADVPAAYLNALEREVTDITINLKDSLLTIKLEQTIEAELIKAIQTVIKKATKFNSNKITVEILTGQGEPAAVYSNLNFSGLDILSHDFKFDYHSSDIATHKLVVKFNNYTAEQLISNLQKIKT